MLDRERIGRQLARLRREKGMTGEAFAERLGVSPQAVSKWERARSLPETAILPEIARVLGCSIDTLLIPRELIILEAVYTDGAVCVDVTPQIDRFVRDNRLCIRVDPAFVGAVIDSERLKLLLVRYATPAGVCFAHAVQDELLNVSAAAGQPEETEFRLLGAYYGNGRERRWRDVMHKMAHYAYFRWDRIPVNHETFPSDPASDATEYLTLVYLNRKGVHAISCAEGDEICYTSDRTGLYLQDRSRCILPGIARLGWGRGMDCPWGGALWAALRHMGEAYSYTRLMGMSGACWRVCFVDVWDWSCTDALVSFDFLTPLFRAIGYAPVCADRLDKEQRQRERQAILRDIQAGRPVLGMNLRVAPEWGLICGYIENGERFLVRTYFDDETLQRLERGEGTEEERGLVTEEWGGYLVNDHWPFLICHFGEKVEKPSEAESLMRSLRTMTEVLRAEDCGGYRNGERAYRAWIDGLRDDRAFDARIDLEGAARRRAVNDSMLMNLADARRCAAAYLRESAALAGLQERERIWRIAGRCEWIAGETAAFRERLRRAGEDANAAALRQEQAALLERCLTLEKQNAAEADALLLDTM